MNNSAQGNPVAAAHVARWDLGIAGVGPERPRPVVLALGVTLNPFNPRAALSSPLPTAGPVRLTVHDLWGRLVWALVDEPGRAGEHSETWDGRGEAGQVVHHRMTLVR